MTMRAIVGGCMMYGVSADADMPRQLFNVAPALRGRTALQPNVAVGPAIDPALYQNVDVWSPQQFEVEPQSSFLDSATVFLCGMAGAAAGFAATMYARGKRAAEPKVAMLGVGGQVAPVQSPTYSGVMPRGGPMTDSTILVQGGSHRTWSYRSPAVEQVQ